MEHHRINIERQGVLPPAFWSTFWCLSAIVVLACGPAHGFIMLSYVVTAAAIPTLSGPGGRRRPIPPRRTFVLLAMGPAVLAALWGLRWLDHVLDGAGRTLRCHTVWVCNHGCAPTAD